MDLADPGRLHPATAGRGLSEDLRRPWEKPLQPRHLTPVGSGATSPHSPDNGPARHRAETLPPRPGRPKGVPNSSLAPRYVAGKPSKVDTAKRTKEAKVP
jgi:hypothetical protein